MSLKGNVALVTGGSRGLAGLSVWSWPGRGRR